LEVEKKPRTYTEGASLFRRWHQSTQGKKGRERVPSLLRERGYSLSMVWGKNLMILGKKGGVRKKKKKSLPAKKKGVSTRSFFGGENMMPRKPWRGKDVVCKEISSLVGRR